jgi:hypothetical protein
VLLVRHTRRGSDSLDLLREASRHVERGETVVAVKPREAAEPLVDTWAIERVCLRAGALCPGNYEAFTRHFPVRLKDGAKERIRANRPGTFWADVVIGYRAPPEALPREDEPYRLVEERGDVRIYRRRP